MNKLRLEINVVRPELVAMEPHSPRVASLIAMEPHRPLVASFLNLVESPLPRFRRLEKIHQVVEILMGNIHAETRATLREALEKNGVTWDQFVVMAPDEQDAACQIALYKQSTPTEDLITALDLIFQVRYGWPEGTVGNLTIPDVLLALEHATEYDNPARPSIWVITK